MPVWAIVVAHTAENYGFYTMLTVCEKKIFFANKNVFCKEIKLKFKQLPRYLSDISPSFRLEKASLLAAIPYLVMGIAVQFAGHFADYLQARGMQTVAVRKIFNCAGNYFSLFN